MRSRPLRIILFTILTLVVLVLALISPVDRDAIADDDLYQKMDARLDATASVTSEGSLQAGWSRVNITPHHSMPMAGYAARETFETVSDSLNGRVIALRNGEVPVAMISLDLLLFPPMLRDRLREKLDSAGMNTLLYLSATHTHNSVGGWDDSLVGEQSMGKYHPEWIESIASQLLFAIQQIQFQPVRINYWQSDATELVENRVDPERGKKDGIIRGIELVASDSSKAMLYTYSGHPTSIDRHSHSLSGDYPGGVTAELEKQFDFAIFMAGMVGSHRLVRNQQSDSEFLEQTEQAFVDKIASRQSDSSMTNVLVSFRKVPIEFGSSQLRVVDSWKMNDWLFKSAIRPLKGDATTLEIGNILFIGLPCDFSGEIYNVERMDSLAAGEGKHLIITSFNGDYVGYITLDDHYDKSKAEEIRTLNWVGPGFGDYFAAIIRSIVTGEPLTSNQ